MVISSECRICSKEMSKVICKLCGANVCETCYDKTTGLCTACKSKSI